jgi:hypothetical protein
MQSKDDSKDMGNSALRGKRAQSARQPKQKKECKRGIKKHVLDNQERIYLEQVNISRSRPASGMTRPTTAKSMMQ